jgi:cytidine deaminase
MLLTIFCGVFCILVDHRDEAKTIGGSLFLGAHHTMAETKRKSHSAIGSCAHHHVGGIACEQGVATIEGVNQENAAYPSGLCAERTAIFAAQANQPDQPVATLAIAARNENGLLEVPVSPCGACRQVILEIEDRYKQPIRILLYGTKGVYMVDSVKDLLPLCFVEACMR